ncbi:uncharacterized protein LOC115565282 isoform X2 [Drosophila navojoa]|uniref:uncharacterized protein LOC115565282 isoform X2 n=1 Tax=Drosophila navojoa TaxID=7232 RepID=UPI0011BE9A21|nr:uncharacterized protein LOC115565282 isoform X2 [Drosophila navojoa]
MLRSSAPLSWLCACAAAMLLLRLRLLPGTAARSYSNGLIFYELATHTPYLPPTVSVSRGRNLASVKYSEKGSIWSTFGQPCECLGPRCGCCAGLKVDHYMFDQKVCANVTFVPHLEEAQLAVFLNERPSSKYGISLRNPSPFCIPVMMGVPMAMCVQMTDIAMVGNNLNMCMDFVVRLATTDLFEMHFQCMRMGVDGVQYVDKNGNPVVPSASSLEAEAEDEDAAEDDSAKDVQDYDYADRDDQKYAQPSAELEAEAEPEPLPIESEMLMAGDQELAVSSTYNDGDVDADADADGEGEGDSEVDGVGNGDGDGDSNDDVAEQETVPKEEGAEEAEEETAAPAQLDVDNAGESDLKQNEVIETITNSITANEAPAATATTSTTTTTTTATMSQAAKLLMGI